ncbi:MAG: carboxypeptidase regulatory-like domain-containing protein [Planctomycetota bacterium]
MVRGQVLQRGVPYPGLELTLQWFDGMSTGGAPESTRQVVGDEQGRFVWRGRARETPGTVVAVAPKQRLKVWCTGETVLPGQREVKLSVSVVAFDRVLSGRVHSAGTAIAGARLDVNLWPESEVTTGADGRYEMHVPAPGYPLTVRAAGYRERLVQGYLPGDAMRHEFDVELVPGAQLVGRVVDGDGRPVEGAKVRASGAFHGVDSGADGTFVVDGMAAGHNHAVVVTKKGYQRARAFGTAGGEPLAIVLLPGLTVALRVVDPAAAPIVGATVHLVPQPMSAWTRLGITGLDGRFAVTELSKEAVELVVEKAGFVTARRPVAAGEASGELVVTLAPGQAISGQVVDAAGQPIAGASIRCERGGASVDRRDGRADQRAVGSQVSSDADGRFEVTGVPPEPCTLFAHHVGYQPGEFAFVGGATAEITVRLQRAPAVAGRVVDGTTGAPIAAFTVGVEGNIERMPLYLDPLPFQAADGSWLVRNWQLKTGVRFSIVVSAPGYAPVRVVTEAVTEPAPDQNIVRLFAGTRVTGIVRDPASGQPLAGVTVALVTPDPALRPNEGPATDASGAFAIAAVPAGEQRLRLQHLDRPEVVFGPFVVGAGPGEVEVQPTMSAGVALRGRVTGVADAAGLTVQAYRADGRIAKATVRDDLTFELRGLGIGRTRICIGEPSRRTRYLRIEVGDHDVDGFVLPLRSGAGVIRLTVEGAASGLAEVRRLDTPAGQAEISDDVEFRGGALVDGLPPGRYRVVVRANEGGKRGSADVDVPGGEVALHIVCGARD